MNARSWFLPRLYRHNKWLFAVVLLFMFFQFYFNQKRIHSFPWFVWDMYSREAAVPDTVTQTEFFINGKRLNITSVPIWEEATILHTYQMYNWQKMNGDNDPMDVTVKRRTAVFPSKVYHYVAYKINNHQEETNTYPDWLRMYLQNRLHLKIHTLELKDVQYKYRDGKFFPAGSWTVLKTGS